MIPGAAAGDSIAHMTPATATRASDEDLLRMLELARGVDSVELKLTVPDAHHRSTIGALGMDPLDAQIRTVSFFDTPDLTLNKAGVIVRARRVQGREDDSVIKLRPVEPDELPQRLRDHPDMGVELDAMRLGTNDVRRCVKGDRPIRKLFTKSQRAFYAAHAPEGIELDDLTLLGPIFVLKLSWTPKQLRQKMVAEAWFYPNGSRILELSTKCPPAEMFQAAAEARGYLADNGVDLSGQQQAKTKTALDFFVKQHRAG
jgi:hypothetical protein